MNCEQLTFFPETSEEKFDRRIKELKDHIDKLRKSGYAERAEIKKENKSLKEKIEFLESRICKHRYDLFS